jgi:phosphoribosyl-ATP pyrophosphohydrolase/phosphoribosyl-AMP cyclohydrolase
MARVIENGKVLYPVTVQDAATLQILMSAFADDQALELTRTTGLAHFYSRSRNALWRKGDTSGNRISVSQVVSDCDQDSFLYLARPEGPVCHLGTTSCFRQTPTAVNPLAKLQFYVEQAITHPRPDSYTLSLIQGDLERLVKKIGEEAIEVITAAYASEEQRESALVWESVDLLYHLTVVWARFGITLDDLKTEILRRHPPNLSSESEP